MNSKPASPDPDPAKKRNEDPITGAPGAHPVGTGLGAAAGGAAAGAATGSFAGPIGAAAGAAVGAVVGGLAGKAAAEKINPTEAEAYWREHHARQPFAEGRPYDEYGPAYRAGIEGYAAHGASGATFNQREDDLRRHYETLSPRLPWERARPAARAAWEQLRRPPSAVDGTPRGGPL